MREYDGTTTDGRGADGSDRQRIETSKAIQRRTGTTFHVATRLLPRRVRLPTYVLYAFFRVADEVVDDPDPAPPDEQRARLEQLRRAALGAGEPDDEVVAAFEAMRRRHEIPDEEIDAFVDAMAMDVDGGDVVDPDDRERYLRGSAVAVGNMLLAVMEPAEPATAAPHAKALAEAFQLTNFLRDVREDVEAYDRVYLSRAVLDRHGLSPDDVRRLEHTPALAEAVADELRATEELYREGVAGIRYLPEDCQFAVTLAATLYAEHHRLIRAADYDVVSARRTLTHVDRARVLVRTAWHWWRTGDPEATFAAASAVPRTAPDDAGSGESDPSHDGASHFPETGAAVRTWTGAGLRRVGTALPWRTE